MSNQDRKVEPLRFEPAAAPVAEKRSGGLSATAFGRGWVILALCGLAALGLAVFLWLPSTVDTEAIEARAVAATPARDRAAPAEVSPWSEAQSARQRKAAQDILAELLDEQFALEELGVEQWAAEDFAAARTPAAEGDELYRRQQYTEAADRYRAGLDAMRTLRGRAEAVYERSLELGMEALAGDRAEAAVRALELAVLLRPELPEPRSALARARNLAPLLELLARADEARAGDDFETALALSRRALALDPQHPGAGVRAVAVERDIARRDFNAAMSGGYRALDDDRYDEAEQAFLGARKLMPDSAEAASALSQARTARTAARIEAHRRRAVAAEEREDWDEAVAAYREISNIDDSVVFARAGLIRSRTRSELNGKLLAALATPERFNDADVYRDARALYRQALALERKGPLLRRQLSELDEILRLAAIPISVLLRSDELTDVTVYRVAHLGAFRSRQLDLKPGTYTAVGIRPGYRDVRLRFTVAHDRDNGAVDIRCTEPI